MYLFNSVLEMKKWCLFSECKGKFSK